MAFKFWILRNFLQVYIKNFKVPFAKRIINLA